MSRWIAGRRLVVAIVALTVVGCAGSAGSEASPGAPSGAPSGAPATTSPPTPVTEPGATPGDPAPSLGEPPLATLAAEGGDPVAGSLGSFIWGDGGSDSPWLPGTPIAAASGEPLTVRLAADVPIKDWVAKRVPAGSADGADGAVIADGGATSIAFPAPGPGRWSVQVTVTFGNDLGSAAYYWMCTVQ